MPGWVETTLAKAQSAVTKLIEEHVFRDAGTTFAVTVLVALALLNPYFGSTAAKAFLIRYMVHDPKEFKRIIEDLKDDEAFSKTMKPGIKAAGYYDVLDKDIVTKWGEKWHPDPRKDEAKQLAEYPSIELALQSARQRDPPFQLIGTALRMSMPACAGDRPDRNTVYISSNSQVKALSALHEGDKVRIERSDDFNKFIVANVRLVSINPADETDGWLNYVQFKDMLGFNGAFADLHLIKTTDGEPNQDVNDDKGNLGGCRR